MKRKSKPRDDEAKRIEILDFAAECFMRKGYYATTIDDVADGLGSTKGLIYYHFRSKTELFFEVDRRAMNRVIERARPIAKGAGTGAQLSYRLGKAHLLGMMANLAYHHVSKQGVDFHLLAALTKKQQEELRELIVLRDVYEGLFAGAIAAGMKDNTLNCSDARLAARTYLGSLNGMSVWYRPRKSQSDADREQLCEIVLSQILLGLAVRNEEDQIEFKTASDEMAPEAPAEPKRVGRGSTRK